ncbi:MAG TPA: hypothetical protein VJA28_03105 [Patescibacteria group bacterium]|nr:hypothetical protein [Patescibacteria group bacterium]
MKFKIILGLIILGSVILLVPFAHGLMMDNIPEGFAPGVNDPKVINELAKGYVLMLWLIIALGLTCLAAIAKDVLDEIHDARLKNEV